jgi:hypothetical protein
MMKKLILIAVCAMSLNACAVFQDSTISRNYTSRIGTNQKLVPIKERQVAPRNQYIVPSRASRSFYQDYPDNWMNSRNNWNWQQK